uniref:Uncharacterized protein n=1 Tax=Escherichia coli TaxID=562 RepID=A0A2Z5UBC9_ECOLX|nr:hypothetical protein [Escherichia coli]BBB03019.1 hypothetical protein [Escherichia coli]
MADFIKKGKIGGRGQENGNTRHKNKRTDRASVPHRSMLHHEKLLKK